MKKIILILFPLFSFAINTNAQSKIYQLHPIIGDTIEYSEIEKYYLFDDLKVDSSNYQIINEENLFYLVKLSDNADSKRILLTENKILLEKEKVVKINNYLLSLNKTDSIKPRIAIETSDNLNIDLDTQNPEFIKSVKKSVKHKFWEEGRKQYQKEQEMGLYGRSY